MHILHIVLYTFANVLARRSNLFKNQEVFQLIIIFFILMTIMFDSGMIWKEKLDASYS